MGRKPGFTLMEMVIYMLLVTLILGIVYRMAVLNRRQMERPASSFRLQEGVLLAHRLLRQDLEETDIHTIRIFPDASNPKEPPGISIASPRSLEDGAFRCSPTGAPLWQKIIYYTLQADPDNPEVSNLIRREGTIAGLPSAFAPVSPDPPSVASFDRGHTSIAARNICSPGVIIESLQMKLDERGGFSVLFSDAGGQISDTGNPLATIVTIRLMAQEISKTTGKPSVIDYRIWVCPRN